MTAGIRKKRLTELTAGVLKKDNLSLFSCTHPSGRTQLAAAKLFVCVGIVRGFEEEDFLANLHSVLFCLIKKRSVEPYVRF